MKEELKATHVPQTSKYDGEEVLKDLLEAALELLVENGRLVFLFPVETSRWSEIGVRALPSSSPSGSSSPPTHRLEVMFTAEEKLKSNVSRVLVTMVKVRTI